MAGVIVTLPLRLVSALILAAMAALAYPFVLWWQPLALALPSNLDLPLFACGILGTALLVARATRPSADQRFFTLCGTIGRWRKCQP